MRRSVPTTSKRPSPIGDVGFGGFEHRRGDGLALSPASSRPLDRSRARRHRRARGDRGQPGSRDRCRRAGGRPCAPGCRAAPPQPRKDVAWPWPVDCTLRPSTSVPPPGKAEMRRLRSACRRHARASRRCRCRAACRACAASRLRASKPRIRRARAPCRGSPRTRRCRRWCRPRSCTASPTAGSDCAGAARPDRCRSCAPPRRPALEHVVRLGPAGAAIGPGRHRVGEDATRRRRRLAGCRTWPGSSGRNCWSGCWRRPSRYRRPCCRGGGCAARETCPSRRAPARLR